MRAFNLFLPSFLLFFPFLPRIGYFQHGAWLLGFLLLGYAVWIRPLKPKIAMGWTDLGLVLLGFASAAAMVADCVLSGPAAVS
ncbi:MAG: hypothetical protein AAF570_17605, partial [Bacteroidota bacterium]